MNCIIKSLVITPKVSDQLPNEPMAIRPERDKHALVFKLHSAKIVKSDYIC